MSASVHVELFGGEAGTAHGYAQALASAGITVWSVDNSEARHARNPYAWFTGDWREGLDRALQTGRVVSVGASPPCTKNSAGTRALDRSRYDNDPDLEHVRDVLIETRLPYVIENVESEVTRRKMRDPLRLCGSEFNLQADDPATGLRLWLKRHRLFESNVALLGAGGCRHPKGLRCAGVYGGASTSRGRGPDYPQRRLRPEGHRSLTPTARCPRVDDRARHVPVRPAGVHPPHRRTAGRIPRCGGGMTGYRGPASLDGSPGEQPGDIRSALCPSCGKAVWTASDHFVSGGHFADPDGPPGHWTCEQRDTS